MKKKIIIILIIVVFFIACGFGIKAYISSSINSNIAEPEQDNNISQLRNTVEKGYIKNTVSLDGVVVNGNEEEYTKICEEYKNGQDVKILCKVYDDVKKDDVLFKIDNKEYKSAINGKIKEIVNKDNQIIILVLDYDLLYIDVKVNYLVKDKMSIGDMVTVKESNPMSKGDEFQEKIVGFDIENSLIDVYISNFNNYLSGTEFNIEYSYENEVETCYILKQMLMQDIDDYYVYVENNGEREKRKVTIGSQFTSINGDNVVEFVEICSGLSEGEKLVIDIIE